jgi:hypothetical protein
VTSLNIAEQRKSCLQCVTVLLLQLVTGGDVYR